MGFAITPRNIALAAIGAAAGVAAGSGMILAMSQNAQDQQLGWKLLAGGAVPAAAVGLLALKFPGLRTDARVAAYGFAAPVAIASMIGTGIVQNGMHIGGSTDKQ